MTVKVKRQINVKCKEGGREKEKAGHYSKTDIFKKIIESYPWFTILNILPVEAVQKLLSDELIQKLRSDSLRSKYTYVKSRLQSIIPATG